MRHLKKGRKFHRKRGQRKAFLKGLAHNLISYEKIETTLARAKELKPFIERLITYAKKQNLTGLRMLLKKLPKESAFKLFYEIAPNYLKRKGGYVRIKKLAKCRLKDGAELAVIEFVEK